MTRNTPHRHALRGVASLELALVFSLIFAFLWAIVSYLFPLLLLQSLNVATAEAVRAVARVPLTTTDYQAAVRNQAISVLESELSWLPEGWVARIDPSASSNVQFRADPACNLVRPNCRITISLRYENYLGNPIVPTISLPGIGQVPPLPPDIASESDILLP